MKLKLNGTTIYVSILVVVVIVFGVIYVATKQPSNDIEVVAAETEIINESVEVESVSMQITVHIVGEVVNPDVYTLDGGSRIKDIIDMAGGLTEYADIESINLAAFLEDAEQITIPTKPETQNETSITTISETEQEAEQTEAKTPATNTTNSNSNKSKKININTAEREELMTLDGIGETLAKSIIMYREIHGGFDYIEEIKNVDRIGLKTFDKIKAFIHVN